MKMSSELNTRSTRIFGLSEAIKLLSKQYKDVPFMYLSIKNSKGIKLIDRIWDNINAIVPDDSVVCYEQFSPKQISDHKRLEFIADELFIVFETIEQAKEFMELFNKYEPYADNVYVALYFNGECEDENT